MIWNNWTEFFAMGGYALYVWGAVAAGAAAIVFELLELAGRRRRALSFAAAIGRQAPGGERA
jgi:heme exporter protein D